jgi:hypothetical protein
LFREFEFRVEFFQACRFYKFSHRIVESP